MGQVYVPYGGETMGGYWTDSAPVASQPETGLDLSSVFSAYNIPINVGNSDAQTLYRALAVENARGNNNAVNTLAQTFGVDPSSVMSDTAFWNTPQMNDYAAQRVQIGNQENMLADLLQGAAWVGGGALGINSLLGNGVSGFLSELTAPTDAVAGADFGGFGSTAADLMGSGGAEALTGVSTAPFDIGSVLNADLPVGTTTAFSPDITTSIFDPISVGGAFTPDYLAVPGVDQSLVDTALTGVLPESAPGSIYDGINTDWLDPTGTVTGNEMLQTPFNELPDVTNPSTGLPDEQPPAEVTTTTPTNVTQPATTAKTNPFYDWLATKTGLSSNVIGGIVGGLSALARIQGAKDNKDSAQSAYNNARPASWSNNLQGGAWGSPQRRNPYTGQPYARGGSAGCTECGGLSSLPKGYVPGSTGGQDDLIDAKLSDGEYVFDADTVAALGDGNNAAGAKKLDQMRANIRTHKRAAPAHKIPPKAKHPEAYLNKGK